MHKILVASSKGGCGKTTVATNLAAYFAQSGKNTVLVDADRQGSSMHWAERRAGLPAPVLALPALRRDWAQRVPSDADILIVDAPAAIRPAELDELLGGVHVIVVPLLPSRLDLEASATFLDDVARLSRVKRGKVEVGLVANRIKPWTNASQEAIAEIRRLPFPLLAELRDTQGYVLLAGLGKGIFDYHSELIRSHQEDWAKLLRWLKKHAG